ncbi:pimeloyl-ACP methyl ester carboxylesterase [Mycobacterium sp. OAS707]|uniref:alpha/beta fold hydrolase n=1 Tax=Mycobacterium sp. OAS707 TaxID=2663822 RepID=UPI00178994A7|nr:alpha/beta fold hydrolase [Mycobacterium sp. OAS707]MBE1552370.1 pimeloyl-ACP methyl ester carboxylesterase [Mycobacterium sp. OAS707]
MTMNAKRRRAHDKLAALPGVRAVRRPIRPDGTEDFDLFYVRTGRKSTNPLVVIPGGPGAASIALYRGFRRRAAAEGLDVIMIEHRGVGMSRHDDSGTDLPPEALTIDQVVDDVAAVLDDAHVAKATIYGTSYGTYVAAGVGVRHPDRVHAMILDSPVLSADDIDAVREATRRLLWDGDSAETADLAAKVRQLVDQQKFSPQATQLAAAVYGFAGPAVLRRQLDLLLAGRLALWSALDRGARFLFERKAPYRHEPDLVGRIGYRELNYAAAPDGKPLDPAVAFLEFDVSTTEFEAEPFDLVEAMPMFNWPTVVISGGRDLITPPAVADRIASLIPGAVLVRLATAGHSAIDLRERAALDIIKATYDRATSGLPARARKLDAAPGGLGVRLAIWAIAGAAAVEKAVPAAVPRTVHRVTAS